MTLSQKCHCGERNHGSQPQSDRSGHFREIEFECGECHAEGVVTAHRRAGIISRAGSYFGKGASVE